MQFRKGGSLGSGGANAYKAASKIVADMKVQAQASGSGGAKALTVSGSAALPFGAVLDPRLPSNAVHLSQLLPVVQAPTGSFQYLRQTTRTNNAAPVDLGGLKPTSVFGLERVSDDLITVAHLTEQVPRQYLEDEPSLTDFLASELVYGLMLAIDDQVVNGDGAVGAPPTELVGILATSGIQTQAFDTSALKSIRLGLAKLAIAGVVPDTGNDPSSGVAIALHPSDFAAIELTVDSAGNYITGGPINSADRRLWGVPVVPTVSIAAGSALIGDFSTLTLYQRGPVAVDWTENVGDDFARNYLRFRCETRIGIAVPRPLAFVTVDIAA